MAGESLRSKATQQMLSMWPWTFAGSCGDAGRDDGDIVKHAQSPHTPHRSWITVELLGWNVLSSLSPFLPFPPEV